ncbi:FAD-binding oxidoreductase [Oceanibium sediminis]|uniref:FAD-binding oxidoreductase n=1 Tax=Oceanibium sediminis TaxID=2026339 RepID=UPI0018E57F99|nr:FAD-binding oxidoreductase [Oceanibium sediminis]
MSKALSENALTRLTDIVGPSGIVSGDATRRYLDDPRGKHHGQTGLVVKPEYTEQVAQIVTACGELGLGIVPFGAGSGGVAGHMSLDDRPVVTLSLERMAAIRQVDARSNVIVVEAGAILADVQRAAEAVGRKVGLRLASEESCTIGGNLATNAGGVNVLRYGSARDQCLGIEAVMPDGSVLSDIATVRKNNTGYDLRHLMSGSEGTLGIITAAALTLFPSTEKGLTALCAVPSPDAALDLLHALTAQFGTVVTAFELLSRLGLSLALKHIPDLPDPMEEKHDWYVLLQVDSAAAICELIEQWLGEAFETGLIQDAVLASSQKQADALWKLREAAYEYNRLEGAFVTSDTAVPLSGIGTFIDEVAAGIARVDPALRANFYGHVGDGNIHVNIFPPEGTASNRQDPGQQALARRLSDLINEVSVTLGGTISAEHGIGRSRIADHERFADPTKRRIQQAIKQAVDPRGVMNPGALFRD